MRTPRSRPKSIRKPAHADVPSKESRQGIQSIEVGVRLLQALATHRHAMMLRDLALAADMSAAKAHRYLVSFIRMGLIEQDGSTGRYDLGSFALRLGLVALGRLDAFELARKVLAELRDQLDQTMAAAVWGNHGATIVQWLDSSHPATVSLRIGAVMPLVSSATGRCFAAFMQSVSIEEQLRLEIAAAQKSPLPHLIRTPAQFARVLDESRRYGLTHVEGDLLPGVNALSAPVFDAAGTMILALTMLGPAGLFDSRYDGPLAAALKSAAHALSRRLGHDAQG